MNNSTIKLSASAYFGMIFFVLIFVAIYLQQMVFDIIVQTTGGNQIAESQAATKETTEILLSLDKITLDTSLLNSEYINTLNVFPNFPIDSQSLANFGKTNPFLGEFSIVSAKASSTVGGVVYSSQRSANNGGSVIPVSSNRR